MPARPQLLYVTDLAYPARGRRYCDEDILLTSRLRAEFDSSGLRLDAVPVLAMPMEELAKRQLSPQEGFAITRIDGSSDLASLIKLGPMPALDAQLLFWKLARQELIRFLPKK